MLPTVPSLWVTFYEQLKAAIAGHDIVYANLAGDLEAMARNIIKTMDETGVKKLILISSIGIYDKPLRSVLTRTAKPPMWSKH
jgi:hypothetical protein